jgi:hypothetical protein
VLVSYLFVFSFHIFGVFVVFRIIGVGVIIRGSGGCGCERRCGVARAERGGC